MSSGRTYCVGYKTRKLLALLVLSAEPINLQVVMNRMKARGFQSTPSQALKALRGITDDGFATCSEIAPLHHVWAVTTDGEFAQDEAFELLRQEEVA